MTKTRKARLKVQRRVEIREREAATRVTARLCHDRNALNSDNLAEWYQKIYDDIKRHVLAGDKMSREAMAAELWAPYTK
jgi:hypothetical protein